MLKPSEPRSKIAYDGGTSIPRSFNVALQLFAENQEVRTLLGEEFAANYEQIKLHELDEFLSEISAWEREHLMLNV